MNRDHELLLAYLAGIIDGEAFVGFQSAGAGRRREFMVHVNMTDKGTIDLLHDTFGGSVREKKPANERCQTQYVWRVKETVARSVIAQLLPYLRIKNSIISR